MTHEEQNSTRQRFAKLAIAAVLALLCGFPVAPPALAQGVQPQLPAALEKKLSARAQSVDEVTMDKSALKFASQFLFSKPQYRQARGLIENLNGIYVRDYQFAKPGEYSQEDIAAIRKLFQGSEWKLMIHTRERSKKSGEEVADIYMKAVNGTFEGMAVLDVQPTELSIVYISGPIRPEQLHELSGNFGVPKLPANAHPVAGGKGGAK